jgi:hypothetical protein
LFREVCLSQSVPSSILGTYPRRSEEVAHVEKLKYPKENLGRQPLQIVRRLVYRRRRRGMLGRAATLIHTVCLGVALYGQRSGISGHTRGRGPVAVATGRVTGTNTFVAMASGRGR